MAKKTMGGPRQYIEVQKGPVECRETDSLAFYPSEGPTSRDMADMDLRRSGMTLTKHEPKR